MDWISRSCPGPGVEGSHSGSIMEKQRILLVDDDERFTRILKLNLESRGYYEVRDENRADRALAVAREFRPDLILLDVMMPDVDGGEVAARFRSDYRMKETPVVFLTAAASKQEVQALEGSIGGHSFLAKPVTMGEVLECLRKHLDQPARSAQTSNSNPPGGTPAPAVPSLREGQGAQGLQKSGQEFTVRRRFLVPAMAAALLLGMYWGYQLYTQPQRLLRQTLTELQKTIKERSAVARAGLTDMGEGGSPDAFQSKASGLGGAEILSALQGNAGPSLLNDLAVSIVKLRCKISVSSDQSRRGSGILYRSQSPQSGALPYFIQTSLHVVKTTDGSIPKCKAFFYPDYTKGDRYILYRTEGYRFLKQDVDFAILEPQEVKDDVHGGSMEELQALARDEARNPLCKSAVIGDRLSILGFPAIGGETLTVTEGIISGFEFQGDTRFIKSSAKLDHGNSGGLAIKDSGCVIGIPTFVQRGPLESMGRILDLNYLYKYALN